jgi:hypothetical protein
MFFTEIFTLYQDRKLRVQVDFLDTQEGRNK